MRSDNHAGPLGRVGELRLDDCGESQVAERAASIPALVAALGEDDLGPRGGLEVRQRRKPVDAGEPMAGSAAPLCIQEVISERLGVLG